jgi:hypothetical protein
VRHEGVLLYSLEMQAVVRCGNFPHNTLAVVFDLQPETSQCSASFGRKQGSWVFTLSAK